MVSSLRLSGLNIGRPSYRSAHRGPRAGSRPDGSTGERQDAHARTRLGKLLAQKLDGKRPTGMGRWIEAKGLAVL